MKKAWPTQTMQSLCKDVNVGHVGPSSMHRDPTGIAFLMGKNVGTGVIYTHNIERVTEAFHRSQPKSRLRPGDIVVVRIGKSGQAAKIPEDFGEANCSGLVVIKQPQGIHPDFLVYYLNSPIGRGYSLSQARGSTRLTLNTSSVAETLVPVPPMAEQQRIVGLLDEAFEGLAIAKVNAEKNLQNARALFESHLQSVFTQRGPGWVEYKLGDLIQIQNGYAFKSDDYTDTGHFVIRISNVQDGEITLANPRFIKLVDKKLERFVLNEGDILISLTGNIGRVGIIQEDQLPAVLNQRVARITIKAKNADRDFLFRFLLSRIFRETLQAAGHGAAQQNVSTKDIESVELSLPDKTKQRRIVEEFDNFAQETQRLSRIYEQKLAALEALKKSLLHQAFSGNL